MQDEAITRLPVAIVALSGAMDRTVLLNVLREYDAALRANGATGLYVFGSRARGTERPDSDLDLFMDYDPAARIPHANRGGDFTRPRGSCHHHDPQRASSAHEGRHRARRNSGSLMSKDPVIAIRD
jgi:hypothetical protein